MTTPNASILDDLIKEKENLKTKVTIETMVSETEAEAKKTPLVIKKNFIKYKGLITYKDIVGESHPSGTEYKYPKPPKKWDHPEDIPEADKNWIPDHRVLPKEIACILYGHNGIIVGPPGCGKSKDPREICARIGMPYYRFPGMDGLEPADLLGTTGFVDGKTLHIDGPVMKPVRHGGLWVYDEYSKTPSGTNMVCQWLAESDKRDRSVLLYGHEDHKQARVQAHPEFRMLLTDNARGTGDNMHLYNATQVQDSSFINRMHYKMEKDYFTMDVETKALTDMYPWISKQLASMMVSFANIMRTAFNQGSVELPFSFRELQTWSESIAELNGCVAEALQAVFADILTDEEREILERAWRDSGFEQEGL